MYVSRFKSGFFDSLVNDPELVEGEFTSDQSAKASAAAGVNKTVCLLSVEKGSAKNTLHDQFLTPCLLTKAL